MVTAGLAAPARLTGRAAAGGRAGISYDKLGRYGEAVADFARAVELDPTNANALFNRGSALDSLGEFDRAVADYTRALQLDMSIALPRRE